MDEYRFGVTGSRNWMRYGPVEKALRWVVKDAQGRGLLPVLAVGDCPTGADKIARDVWRSWGWEPKVFFADWDNCVVGECPRRDHRVVKRSGDRHHPGELDTYCPKAGPRRNGRLVASGLRVLLAFPEGLSRRSGTWQCINAATRVGVPVLYPERWQ